MKKNFLTKKTFSSLFAATFLTIPLLILQGCGGDASGENTSVSTSSPVYQDLTPGENITIKGRNFSKTSFATVIPQNSSVTIPSEKFPRIGNVFIWDRTVTLNSYEISKYEVTQELYEYPGSNNYKKVAWSVLNSSGYSDDDLEIRTHEVGTRQPNSLGLYDMAGNAYEWCYDYWKCKQPGYESSIPKGDTHSYINPVEDSGTFTDPVVNSSSYKSRVIRGGNYGSTIFYLKNDCRYFEYQYVCAKNTSTSQKTVGIRLARRK